MSSSANADRVAASLNGAAARTCQPGDQVIICNSLYVDEAKLTVIKPRVLTFDKDNRIADSLIYSVEHSADGGYSFSILNEVPRGSADTGARGRINWPSWSLRKVQRLFSGTSSELTS